MNKQIEQAVEEYHSEKLDRRGFLTRLIALDGNLRGGASFARTNRTRANRDVGQRIEKSEC